MLTCDLRYDEVHDSRRSPVAFAVLRCYDSRRASVTLAMMRCHDSHRASQRVHVFHLTRCCSPSIRAPDDFTSCYPNIVRSHCCDQFGDASKSSKDWLPRRPSLPARLYCCPAALSEHYQSLTPRGITLRECTLFLCPSCRCQTSWEWRRFSH